MEAVRYTLYDNRLLYVILTIDNNCDLTNSATYNVVGNNTNEVVASVFGIVIMFITVAYAR